MSKLKKTGPKCDRCCQAGNLVEVVNKSVGKLSLCDLCVELVPEDRPCIRYSDLRRLTFVNSKKLDEPPFVHRDENGQKHNGIVEINSVRNHYVGIGWIEHGPADGTECLVVEG